MCGEQSKKFPVISKKKIIRIGIAIVSLALCILIIAPLISPRPSVFLLRFLSNRYSEQLSQTSEQYVPANVEAMLDIQYREDENDAYLDLYYPSDINKTDSALPLIVWVHGGGWILGDKKSVANYSKILASEDYIVAAVNYSLAPEKQYPVPLSQINDALAYLTNNYERFNIDVERIIIAGNSAGAHIAAQLATVISSPEYREIMDIEPSTSSNQLKAVILANGAYDTSLLTELKLNIFTKKLFSDVLWTYSGQKDFENSEAFVTGSVINYVTSDFPPAFITVGNGDPLEAHSIKLAERLENLDVPIKTIFYEEDHEPKLPHGYIFDLDTIDGQNALAAIIEFLSINNQMHEKF